MLEYPSLVALVTDSILAKCHDPNISHLPNPPTFYAQRSYVIVNANTSPQQQIRQLEFKQTINFN
jgi:hypothetical protein